MDVDKKPTVLEDGADIYQKRVIKTERQKFSELHGRDKWQYFKDYYARKLLVLAVILAFVAYFVYSAIDNNMNNTLLNTAVIDCYFPQESVDRLVDDFKEYIGFTSKRDIVIFDSSYFFSGQDYQGVEKINVLMAAGELDVIIAPEEYFEPYMNNGIFISLTNLPTDLYVGLSDLFCYGTTGESPMEGVPGDTDVYGVYVDGFPFFESYFLDTRGDRLVLGIVVNGGNREGAMDFLRFMATYSQPDVDIE